MKAEANSDLESENIAPENRTFLRSADMRYYGEGQEMTVAFPAGNDFSRSLAEAIVEFHRAYKSQFGFNYEDQTPVEVVNLRLTAIGGMKRFPRRYLDKGKGSEFARSEEREVYFAATGFASTPVFERSRLGRDDRIEGSAIIEDFGSTTVVPPGGACEVDEWGNLRISLPVFSNQKTSQHESQSESQEVPSPVVQEIVKELSTRPSGRWRTWLSAQRVPRLSGICTTIGLGYSIEKDTSSPADLIRPL